MTAIQILATALAIAVVLVTLCAITIALHFARVKPKPGFAAIVIGIGMLGLAHFASQRRHRIDLGRAAVAGYHGRMEAMKADVERLERDVGLLTRWVIELHTMDDHPAPSHVVQRSMEAGE